MVETTINHNFEEANVKIYLFTESSLFVFGERKDSCDASSKYPTISMGCEPIIESSGTLARYLQQRIRLIARTDLDIALDRVRPEVQLLVNLREVLAGGGRGGRQNVKRDQRSEIGIRMMRE